MALFSIAHSITALVEGGYANDPEDRGGETYKGIARKMHPGWVGWKAIDDIKKRHGSKADSIDVAASVNYGLQNQVLNFYKALYWDALNLDLIKDQQVANELYDTGVNMGTGVAAKYMQRALNTLNLNGIRFPDLDRDNQIGARTIAAFNSLGTADKHIVWKLLNAQQGVRYMELCEADRTQEKFMRSWASRVFESS